GPEGDRRPAVRRPLAGADEPRGTAAARFRHRVRHTPSRRRETMKTSLGIWAFGSMVTRFVPGGYQPEHAGETTVERVRRAVDGLGDLIDGYEFHYPQELDEDNVDEVREALGPDHDIYCLAG